MRKNAAIETNHYSHIRIQNPLDMTKIRRFSQKVPVAIQAININLKNKKLSIVE